MFSYIFVSFVAMFKHLLIGLSSAFANVAGYANHYQVQLEAKINRRCQTPNTVTVVHEPRCEVMEDGSPNPEQLQ